MRGATGACSYFPTGMGGCPGTFRDKNPDQSRDGPAVPGFYMTQIPFSPPARDSIWRIFLIISFYTDFYFLTFFLLFVYI